MNEKQRNLVSMINVLCDTNSSKEKAASSGGSHQMTLTQPEQKVEQLTEDLNSLTSEHQLTVRNKVTLTRRQIGLLLEILNYQAVYFGVNFGQYLAMEHALTLLIGQKSSTFEIKDKYERTVSTVANILLLSLGEKDLNIVIPVDVPQSIVQKLIEEKLIMDRRVYGSRHAKWKPESFFQVRAVPLNVQFEREKGTSEKYSSYCKGYGESHPSAHYKKTKQSIELDGEAEDRVYLSLTDIQSLLILTQLEMRAKYIRRDRKS